MGEYVHLFRCHTCGKSPIGNVYRLNDMVCPSLLKCSSCRVVSYCSSICQTSDWKRHRRLCRAIAAASKTDCALPVHTDRMPDYIYQLRTRAETPLSVPDIIPLLLLTSCAGGCGTMSVRAADKFISCKGCGLISACTACVDGARAPSGHTFCDNSLTSLTPCMATSIAFSLADRLIFTPPLPAQTTLDVSFPLSLVGLLTTSPLAAHPVVTGSDPTAPTAKTDDLVSAHSPSLLPLIAQLIATGGSLSRSTASSGLTSAPSAENAAVAATATAFASADATDLRNAVSALAELRSSSLGVTIAAGWTAVLAFPPTPPELVWETSSPTASLAHPQPDRLMAVPHSRGIAPAGARRIAATSAARRARVLVLGATPAEADLRVWGAAVGAIAAAAGRVDANASRSGATGELGVAPGGSTSVEGTAAWPGGVAGVDLVFVGPHACGADGADGRRAATTDIDSSSSSSSSGDERGSRGARGSGFALGRSLARVAAASSSSAGGVPRADGLTQRDIAAIATVTNAHNRTTADAASLASPTPPLADAPKPTSAPPLSPAARAALRRNPWITGRLEPSPPLPLTMMGALLADPTAPHGSSPQPLPTVHPRSRAVPRVLHRVAARAAIQLCAVADVIVAVRPRWGRAHAVADHPTGGPVPITTHASPPCGATAHGQVPAGLAAAAAAGGVAVAKYGDVAGHEAVAGSCDEGAVPPHVESPDDVTVCPRAAARSADAHAVLRTIAAAGGDRWSPTLSVIARAIVLRSRGPSVVGGAGCDVGAALPGCAAAAGESHGEGSPVAVSTLPVDGALPLAVVVTAASSAEAQRDMAALSDAIGAALLMAGVGGGGQGAREATAVSDVVRFSDPVRAPLPDVFGGAAAIEVDLCTLRGFLDAPGGRLEGTTGGLPGVSDVETGVRQGAGGLRFAYMWTMTTL